MVDRVRNVEIRVGMKQEGVLEKVKRSQNMSLLKIIIPFFSWLPSSSSSFHLSFRHSPY